MKVFAELFSKSDPKNQSHSTAQSPNAQCALKTSRWEFFGATFFLKKVAKKQKSGIIKKSK
jgi:hypothetical protein